MAYLHCHACGWEQDDFYSPNGYNPAKYLSSWNHILFNADIDESFGNTSTTKREILAQQYEKFANNIRNMKWVTWDDFKEDPNKLCPKCGKSELDCD
jgi:hypothetical protein